MALDYINLKALTLDELVGVVNLYPWYGAARKELCLRMYKMGAEAWGKSQYSDSALYLGDRRIIADIIRDRKGDYSDKDLEKLLRRYISEHGTPEEEREVHVAGGDFFSQAQYDRVRKEEDNVFSKFASKVKSEAEKSRADTIGDDFYTETLAQIYIDQGYYEQARNIYYHLLLKFPEKNAYFAALIRKLES